MGGCQSAVNVKATAGRDGGAVFKSKRSGSGDFAALISKLSSGGAAAAFSEARALHQIPGRLFSNGASRIASLYTQQGKKGVNQDAMIVWESFGAGGDRKATFCGVFDGHGPYGHMVAKRVRDVLPVLLRLQWEIKLQNHQNFAHEDRDYQSIRRIDNDDDDDEDDGSESMESEDDEVVPEMQVALKKSMIKASKLMDEELKSHPTIDCFCSGTTAVFLVVEVVPDLAVHPLQGQDLIIGNVGDSRAVLATRDNNNALVALQLTVDLKPNLPREAARIRKCKGRVFALDDEPEVARIWLPNSNSPGLAMARAFGDFCLKDFGLISAPDVRYHRITDRDEFVILATDGVWDVLSNEEALDIVASCPSRGTAPKALVECATRAWRDKYPTSKIDDCAAICLFLDDISSSSDPKTQNHPANGPKGNTNKQEANNQRVNAPNAASPVPLSATRDSDEIVPVTEDQQPEKPMQKPVSRSRSSRRSLAEYLSEAEEWSALEGVTRVNSLISLPRFMPTFGRSRSRRKQV